MLSPVAVYSIFSLDQKMAEQKLFILYFFRKLAGKYSGIVIWKTNKLINRYKISINI